MRRYQVVSPVTQSTGMLIVRINSSWLEAGLPQGQLFKAGRAAQCTLGGIVRSSHGGTWFGESNDRSQKGQ